MLEKGPDWWLTDEWLDLLLLTHLYTSVKPWDRKRGNTESFKTLIYFMMMVRPGFGYGFKMSLWYDVTQVLEAENY